MAIWVKGSRCENRVIDSERRYGQPGREVCGAKNAIKDSAHKYCKIILCACMYIHVGTVRPINRIEISVGGPVYHYSKNVFVCPSVYPCGDRKAN